eukprot:176031-Chlamydomonas_euryale.AAC.2
METRAARMPPRSDAAGSGTHRSVGRVAVMTGNSAAPLFPIYSDMDASYTMLRGGCTCTRIQKPELQSRNRSSKAGYNAKQSRFVQHASQSTAACPLPHARR